MLIWQESRPSYSHCTWKGMMSQQLGHVTNNYGFISTFVKTTKKQNSPQAQSKCTDFNLQVRKTLLQLGHVTRVYGFISTIICSISTELGKMAE